jgi:RNA polymerase sporulation-specific sigma factor
VTKECQSENTELLLRIRNGEGAAMEELVSRNYGLVRKIALRFTGRGAEYEDLVQLGVIGMIKAARSFDFSFGTAFSTYAVPLIMGEMRRFLRDDGPIKVSRSIKQKGVALMREREKFIAQNQREPKISELSELTGLAENDIAYCLEAMSSVSSLSEPIGGEDASLTLESSLADESSSLDTLTDRIALGEAIRKLPPLWRKIIQLRYFDELSQSETGKRLGLTQVKVSREEQKILLFLKKELA